MVAALGRAAADGHLAGGVLPVVKHMPGHGRAVADSHLHLPQVDTDLATLTKVDFAPFKALADLPLAMTAHIVYSACDTRPATCSPMMLDIIRRHIGFGGLLMTDDLSMEALSGSLAERAAASIAAGCDLALYCKGEMADMVAVAEAAGQMNADSRLAPKRRFPSAQPL